MVIVSSGVSSLDGISNALEKLPVIKKKSARAYQLQAVGNGCWGSSWLHNTHVSVVLPFRRGINWGCFRKMMKFGAIMQACRERAGLTQEQMADKLHRTQACISKFENDRKIPDVPTFLAWIEATGAKEVAVAFICGMDGISILQSIMPLIGG